MIGTMKWNIVVGIVAMVVTFIFSITKNIFLTALLRSFYSFIILFVLVFLLRWLLGTVAGFRPVSMEQEPIGQDAEMGKHIDMTTPGEEESLHELLKENITSNKEDHSFSPLNPPKFMTKDKLDPENLAKALRYLSED